MKYFLWLLLFKSELAFSEISVHLRIKANNSFDAINVRKLGMRDQLPKDPDVEMQIPRNRNIDTTLILPGSGFYQIDDATKGHQIFIEDNDEVVLTMTRSTAAYESLHKNGFVMVLNTLQATAKYRGNYLFFDDYFTKIHYLVKFMGEKKEDIPHFKSRCDAAYHQGIELLKKYRYKHLISDNFDRAAYQELNSLYIAWICQPLAFIRKSQLPADYLSLAKTMTFSDSLFAFQCPEYLQAANLLTYYVYNNFDPNNWYSNLKNEYETKKKIANGVVKDQLLSWSIEDYAKADYPVYDSIYNDFLKTCRNSTIRWRTKKKVEQLQTSSPKKNIDIGLPVALAMNFVEDIWGKRSTFKDILSDSQINVIDCWATWCGPCRTQIPYIHEEEEKYKGRVKFIYLSFDKENEKWSAFVKRNNFKQNNQIIMDNEFENPFSTYFEITTIPRYILISAKGNKVLSRQMPLPVNTDAFEAELEKHLSE